MAEIAWAASARRESRTTSTACGSLVWSRISTSPDPSAAGQMVRVGRPSISMQRSVAAEADQGLNVDVLRAQLVGAAQVRQVDHEGRRRHAGAGLAQQLQ